MSMGNDIRTRYQRLHAYMGDISTEHREHSRTVRESGNAPNHNINSALVSLEKSLLINMESQS